MPTLARLSAFHAVCPAELTSGTVPRSRTTQASIIMYRRVAS